MSPGIFVSTRTAPTVELLLLNLRLVPRKMPRAKSLMARKQIFQTTFSGCVFRLISPRNENAIDVPMINMNLIKYFKRMQTNFTYVYIYIYIYISVLYIRKTFKQQVFVCNLAIILKVIKNVSNKQYIKLEE